MQSLHTKCRRDVDEGGLELRLERLLTSWMIDARQQQRSTLLRRLFILKRLKNGLRSMMESYCGMPYGSRWHN